MPPVRICAGGGQRWSSLPRPLSSGIPHRPITPPRRRHVWPCRLGNGASGMCAAKTHYPRVMAQHLPTPLGLSAKTGHNFPAREARPSHLVSPAALS